MAKRQVENTIFEETWFMDLDMPYKMLILYFFITSDHAGLGNLNLKIINTILGYEYDKESVLVALKEHIKEYKPGKYQIIKYMGFHYTEDNRSKIYRSALKKLQNEGLLPTDEEIEFEKFGRSGLVPKHLLERDSA